MENPIIYLTNKLFNYFFMPIKSGISEILPLKFLETELIYFHNEKLTQLGDISLAANVKNWNFFCKKYNLTLTEAGNNLLLGQQPDLVRETYCNKLIQASGGWQLNLERITLLASERYALYFQRDTVMRLILNSVIAGNTTIDGAKLRYGCARRPTQRSACIDVVAPTTTDAACEQLTYYRMKLLANTLRRMLAMADWKLLTKAECEAQNALCIRIVDATGHKDEPGVVCIKVGAVLEPKTKKLCTLNAKEYIELRSNDMLLMALHKYGLRVKQDDKFMKLVSLLGHAAVTVDMFEVRQSSPMLIIRNGMGSTKGASFILYNSARLETLLRTFEEQLNQQNFSDLPAFENIDIKLLKEDHEWQLVFGYILSFPQLIQNCISQLEQGICNMHLIVRYINGLVTNFSGYYRRTQILIYKRPHLMPLVFARIYLIKAVRQVLNDALALLDIAPVQYM